MSRFLVFAGMLVCMMNAFAMDVDKLPPLHRAACDGNCVEIGRLLNEGAQLDECSDTLGEWLTPLHYAVRSGHYAAVELLLKRGADANRCGRSKRLFDTDKKDFIENVHPVHFAAGLPDIKIAELLFRHGARNPELCDAGSPFHVAARYGTPAMIRLLHRSGVCLCGPTDSNAYYPMHQAVLVDDERYENVNELLRLKADVPTNIGEFAWEKCNKFASIFIWRGFRLTRHKEKSERPSMFELNPVLFSIPFHERAKDLLHIAKMISEYSKWIEGLRNKLVALAPDDRAAECDIKIVLDQYNKLLVEFVGKARVLINRRAYVNAWDPDGNFPLHYLIDMHNEHAPTVLDALARHIIQAGARVNVLNRAGQTPLSIAQRRGNRRMVSHLLSHAFKDAVSAGGDITSAIRDIVSADAAGMALLTQQV